MAQDKEIKVILTKEIIINMEINIIKIIISIIIKENIINNIQEDKDLQIQNLMMIIDIKKNKDIKNKIDIILKNIKNHNQDHNKNPRKDLDLDKNTIKDQNTKKNIMIEKINQEAIHKKENKA